MNTRWRSDEGLTVQVGDLEWPWLVGVEQDATLAEAAGLMRELNLGSAGVLEKGTLVGILTERDIMRAVLDNVDIKETLVDRYMTRDPATIPIETDVSKAALAMIALGARHLPVIEGEEIVGMISARDVLHALAGNIEPHPPRSYRRHRNRPWRRHPRVAARAEW